MKYNKQVHLGYDPATGKQMRKWFHANTKADLKNQIEQYKQEMKKTPNLSAITFGEYSRNWLAISKGTKSKQTQDAARTHLRKCSALDPYPLRKITRSQLQSVVNENWSHPHSAKGVADVLRQVFQMAQNDGIIAVNPAVNLDRPKIPQPQRKLLTDGEIEAVMHAELSQQDHLFVMILLTFGLRPAEALALSPNDFDMKAKLLHITKSLEMTNDNRSRIKTTKTDVCRSIPIPDAIIPLLQPSISSCTGFLLFTNANNQMHTKTSYKRMQKRIWAKVNEAAGGDESHRIIYGRTFYDFRHYRATQWYYLCQQGLISTKQAAALLGHSEIIFLQTYSHIDTKKENLGMLYADLDAMGL